MKKTIALVSILFGLILIGIGFDMFSSSLASTNKNVPATYSVIASQPHWLNTERALTPDDLKDRIILLDFWTYCCINCIQAIPDLKKLEAKYGNQLTVIGVHSAKFLNEKDTHNIRDAVLRYDVEHPVVNDANFTIWQNFGVRAWPTLVLINPDGKIEATYSGEGNGAQIDKRVSQLLADYGDRVNSSPLPQALEKDKVMPTFLSFPGKLIYVEDVEGAPALFLSDSSHHRVLGLRENGEIFIEIGSGEEGSTDGDFDTAQFNGPQGMAFKDGTLYIADTYGHRLRTADLTTRKVTSLIGNGQRGPILSPKPISTDKAELASPWDLAFYPDETQLIIANAGTHQLLAYDLEKSEVRAFAGNGREYIDDGPLPFNSLSQPSGLSVVNGKLYFVDSETSSLRVIDGAHNSIKTLIGTGLFDFGLKDGTGKDALLQHAIGLDAAADYILLADSYNHALRQYDIKTGKVTTLIGTGEEGRIRGNFSQSRLSEPNDVVITPSGRTYIVDTNNHQVVYFENGQNTLSVLEIDYPGKTIAYVKAENLPNLSEKSNLVITKESPVIDLEILNNLKVNDLAPSYLALFNEDKKHIQTYEVKDLQSGTLLLPDINPAKTYTLQGTVYVCEELKSDLCEIKSVSIPVTFSEKSANLLKI